MTQLVGQAQGQSTHTALHSVTRRHPGEAACAPGCSPHSPSAPLPPTIVWLLPLPFETREGLSKES